MLSESARMSSAAEARFRIQMPPPTARAVKVIPLDPVSDRLVARLAESSWNGVTFFTASELHPTALADRTKGLMEAAAAADLVVMVATAGADAQAAAIIGEACSRTRVPTATFVVRATSASDEALSKTLAQVRPWSLMVVIASDDDYVEDILRSFR
jgi:hypothetical protein